MDDSSSYRFDHKRSTTFHKINTTLCICCTSFLIPAIIATIASYLSFRHFQTTTMEICRGRSTAATENKIKGYEKHSSQEAFSMEIPWASFYLNQDAFYKGIYRIPWKQENYGDTDITLVDNVNFRIAKKGLYEIYSKITFEISRQCKQKYAYHTLNINDTTGITRVLEKNTVTIPEEQRRTRRMFLISDLFSLREFEAGDTVGVVASSTSVVYHSKIDNTVKIIKRA